MDARPAVLRHGIRGHARTWDHLAAALQPGLRVIALDQRGHGDSQRTPGADYSVGAMVAAVVRLADHLGLGRFPLLAMSMGGHVAIAVAGMHPQRVERLVIVDIGPDIAPEGMERVRSTVGEAPERFATKDEAIGYVSRASPRYNEAELRRRVAHGLTRLPAGGLGLGREPPRSQESPEAQGWWKSQVFFPDQRYGSSATLLGNDLVLVAVDLPVRGGPARILQGGKKNVVNSFSACPGFRIRRGDNEMRSFACVLFILLMFSSASAELVNLGKVTRDTETRLEWLDITETTGLSYNDIFLRGARGLAAARWRQATGAEVCQLVRDHTRAFIGPACPTDEPLTFTSPGGVMFDGVLQSLLGKTESPTVGDTRIVGTHGFFDNGTTSSVGFAFFVNLINNCAGGLPLCDQVRITNFQQFARPDELGTRNTARSWAGHFLVRETPTLTSAILPGSRAVQVGTPATAFATMIATGSGVATGCTIAPTTVVPTIFSYQKTDPATNAPVGPPNTPFDMPGGSQQTLVIAFTPTAPFGPTDVELSFDCANTDPATIISGVNTLLLSATAEPGPDVVALGATATNDGILNLPGSEGANAFAVATINVGSGGEITVIAEGAGGGDSGPSSIAMGGGIRARAVGGTLPVSVSVCQTNPVTGACLAPPAPGVTTTMPAGTTGTFGIFVQGAGDVAFAPARNRVFVRFRDGGNLTKGATSVAVRTR